MDMTGWKIRIVSPEPLWRFTIADDEAIGVELNDAYEVKNFFTVRGKAIDVLLAYFERLWSAGSDYRRPLHEVAEIDIRESELVSTDWDVTIEHLASNPETILDLAPIDFERLIAELLRRDGMNVQLTPPTRDGGRDILAWSTRSTGRLMQLIECKRHDRARKVGVATLRALFGVVEAERAASATLVTTSSFTPAARQFALSVGARLVLRDYGDVAKWLRRAHDAATNRWF